MGVPATKSDICPVLVPVASSHSRAKPELIAPSVDPSRGLMLLPKAGKRPHCPEAGSVEELNAFW